MPVSAVENILLAELRQGTKRRVGTWQPEEGDAVLYAAAALFAGLTARFTHLDLYRQWGELALGPYLAAAVFSAVIARVNTSRAAFALEHEGFLPSEEKEKPKRHWGSARIWVFVFVLVGATLVPLSLEVSWRDAGSPTSHVQPEVVVVERSGHQVALGKDPYQAVTNQRGQVQIHTPGVPTYEDFDPYLPFMTVFGLPSSTKEPIRLTDARIFFSIATFLVVAAALVLCRGVDEPKVRTLQILTVLPTAALPLATGGDDMPIVALLLLAMVLAQRRRPGTAGFVLGVVSAMKFTAWPLAALALFAARDKFGRRAPIRMVLGMLVVVGPVVVPFILRGPFAFFDNVVLYPLGLSGVASPAASPFPGHLIVAAFPSLHRVVPFTAAMIGGAFLIVHLLRRPPKTASAVCTLAGWVMAVGIMFAPATRVGYLLYPINFFAWGYLLRVADGTPGDLDSVDTPDAAQPEVLSSGRAPERVES